MSRYKLYHIPFWLLYNYLWWVVALGNPLKAAGNILFYPPDTVRFFFFVIFQVLAVYFNLYFLIPRYLEKSRFAVYAILLCLTILSAATLMVPGYYLARSISGKTFEQLYGHGTYCFVHFFGITLPATFASMMLAFSIKLTKYWIQTRNRQQSLEKVNLETELNFLKNQFNPHFLFNTINSIFFLIHRNPNMASASLAKFSDLLRYQLYECNDKQIPLHKEITYIENTIELEKIRLNDNVKVTFQFNGQYSDHLGIAPFILMTFIENAFKHVSKETDSPNWIRIRLHVEEDRLHLNVSNSMDHTGYKDEVKYSGIGLKNVQRRLDLLYPRQYELDMARNINSFDVSLQIRLAAFEMPELMQKIG